MKNLFLLLLLLVILSGCEKKEKEMDQLTGSWLEASHQTDTLVFDPPKGMMILNRGKEMRGGFLQPKYHSGPYIYKVKQDSIMLLWLFSSSSSGKRYYIHQEAINGKLKVQNFFVDSLGTSVILNFTKIN